MANFELSQQDFHAAFRTGLKVLQSDIVLTPNSWNKDLLILEQLLNGLSAGELVLRPTNPLPQGDVKPDEKTKLEDGDDND